METSNLTLLILYLAIPSLLISAVQQILSWRKKTTSTTISLVGSSGKNLKKFPGPRQFPLVGRIHDLPRFGLWLKFKEWADEYGPIYTTSVPDATFIIVSDEKIAEELLVKRGHIYSGRPQIRSLIGHKEGVVYSALMDRHDTWKLQRKWCHAAMAHAHRSHFYGHIESETRRFLILLLLSPDQFLDHTREFCGRVMSRLAWDDATQGRLNGESADKTLHCMSVSGPITNTMTPLWGLPGVINPWYRYEVQRERELRGWWLGLFRRAKERMRRGELPGDTWAYRYFEQVLNETAPVTPGDARVPGPDVSGSKPKTQEGGRGGKGEGKEEVFEKKDALDQPEKDETFASCMIGFLNLVGVVTISGPLKFFEMAMALHPEWQRKAQAEIDEVCGDRMPTIADFEKLPILRACLKETVRWRSGVPLGVPHQAERDDEYRGVKIKKGTIVLACEWTINRNPIKYPSPETYNPARYLDPSYPTFQAPLTRYPNFREGSSMHSFGWGRRTCLGQNIVDDEMFVFGAALLWAFDVTPKTCPVTGREVPIDTMKTNSHVILEPVDFELGFRVREGKRERVLEGGKEFFGKV
ncbi:cytochrome P450 [Sordaria brevicollis]|uniref:Cytochrome P450 n=1 Tax=Sordaria brevicollis TaxID=83679 RepID=A0AAE0UDT4_SORBR|nr:cytochrome P450 [Sordaria brevicollis]